MRASLKLILLQPHKKLPKNSTSIILLSFSIWSKLKEWKYLISGYLMRWLQIKKITILKCRLLLFYTTTMDHFSIGLWCAAKSGLCKTTSDDQLSGWTELRKSSKALPKVNFASEKGPGHYLVVSCPADPLTLSESRWNHYIWEVCSTNQRDALKIAMPTTGIGQ